MEKFNIKYSLYNKSKYTKLMFVRHIMKQNNRLKTESVFL